MFDRSRSNGAGTSRGRRLARSPLALVLIAVLVGATVPLGVALVAGHDRDGFVVRTVLPQFLRVRLPAPAHDPQAAAAPEIDLAMAEAQGDTAADIAAAPGEGTPDRATAPGTGKAASDRTIALGEIGFSLTPRGGTAGTATGEAMTVRKTVNHQGRPLGDLLVHVTPDSRLLLDAAEVRGLIKRNDLAVTVAGEGLLDIAALRASGLGLRYDPVSDTIVLTTP